MLRKILSIALLLTITLPVQTFAVSHNSGSGQTVRKLNPRRLNGSEPIDLSNVIRGSSLGSSRIGPLQMGETIYDYQHNGSMGRQVTYDTDSNVAYFVWMWDNLAGDGRAMKYNAYYNAAWVHGSGTSGGIVVSGDNGGYGGIDMASNSRSMIYHHEGIVNYFFRPCAAIDIIPPTGAFAVYCAPSPGADGVINCDGWETGNYEYESAYIWPKAEFDICDGTEIIHMVATEAPSGTAGNGEIQTVVYYRGTADPTTAVITWPSCPMAIDSVYNITVLVREDPNSDEVAISWLHPIYYDNDSEDPCGYTQLQNDIYLWKSDDCGVTWDRGDIENITDYLGNNGTIEGVPMAYTDHSMLYDSDGNLHIVWSTPLKNSDDPCSPLYATKMWHWSDAPGGCISMVYDASNPRFTCDTGAWNMTTAKMNISECDDKFYISFTRFGAWTSDNGDTNADCSEAGYANGEIYLTASTDGGETWGEAINLTNTQSDECVAGDCFSEHWSSMAKYSSDSLHIQYIEDKDAGAISQSEGETTENPVQYITYECFTPDPYCEVTYSPSSFDYPFTIAPQGVPNCYHDETTTFVLTLQNSGNQSSSYTITPNALWISWAGGDQLSGTINAGCDATRTIEIQIGPIATPGNYSSSIDITVCGEMESIPIDVTVYCDVPEPYDILSTACWSIGVWSVGRAGLAQISDLGNMYWYIEEVSLMYDEGVVISYDDTTNTFFSTFDGSDDDVDFVALSSLITETAADYEYATGEFATPDSVICGVIEYYLPFHPDICVLIEHVIIANCDDVAHVVSIGEGVDFDIPDDDGGSDNRAGKDESRQMLYMMGPNGHASQDYYGGVAFDPSLWLMIPGGEILNNDTWVYDNSGYEPAKIGGLLNRINVLSSTIDSVFDNSMFFAIHQNFTLQPDDSIEYCKVKTSSLTGLADLQEIVDNGFQWAKDYDACGCFWGDANSSGTVDIDDVVYLIQFLIADGIPPDPLCNGSVNGDRFIGPDDIRYLVEYIFGSGLPPIPGIINPEVRYDVGEVDTIRVIDSGINVGMGQSFYIPIYVSNDEGIINLNLNLFFAYSGGSGLLSFDGISYSGTRLEAGAALQDRSMNSSGFAGSVGGTLELNFAANSYSDTLNVGSGIVAYLQFTAQGEGTVSLDTLEGCLLEWGIRPSYSYPLGVSYELGEITQYAYYVCGNVDGLGIIDIDDVVYLIQYLYAGGPEPLPLCSGNVNCDDIIDIDDVVYLIEYLYSGGPPPCDIDGDGAPDC